MTQSTQPPTRFVLLCHQRSGSNALSAILNADPAVHLYGQLFNPFMEYRIRNTRARFGAYRPHAEALLHFGTKSPFRPRAERALLSPLPVARDLGRFVGNFWDRTAAPGRVAQGFKLHDYQVSDDDLATIARDHADVTVMLWRRNLLKAAVSWGYAIRTDVWSSRKPADGPPPVYRLDPDEIGWFVRKTARMVEHWRAVLAASGGRWIELTYEDHVVPRDLGGLYDTLGLDWDGPPEFQTRKLSSGDYAHIENAAELDAALGSDETGRLFS